MDASAASCLAALRDFSLLPFSAALAYSAMYSGTAADWSAIFWSTRLANSASAVRSLQVFVTEQVSQCDEQGIEIGSVFPSRILYVRYKSVNSSQGLVKETFNIRLVWELILKCFVLQVIVVQHNAPLRAGNRANHKLTDELNIFHPANKRG